MCVAFSALALLWAYRFKRDDIPWSLRSAVFVTWRVVFVEAAVIAVVCYGCEVTADGFLKLVPFIVLGLLISNRHIQHARASFVDVGTRIIVTGQQNRTLLVKEAEIINSDEKSQT